MKNSILFAVIIVLFSLSLIAEEDGLVSYWDFEGESEIVQDRGPAGVDGKIMGNVERTEGIRGQALSFPGDLESHVVFEDKEALDLREAFTLSTWIYRNNTGTRWDGIIINGRHNHGFQVFYAEMNQKLTVYLHTDEKPYHPITGGYIPMYEWMHLAVTYDGAEVVIYQNGQVSGRQNTTGKVGPFPEVFLLGSAVHPFNAFRGLIDEVAIYSRSLSQDEIKQYYQDTAPENHQPSDEPIPAFKNLHAERSEEGVLFSFEITDEYLQEDKERAEKVKVQIYRNSHPRNDTNPGVNDGKLIYSGTLESDNKGTYTYLDTELLKDGYTYYHWVSPDGKNFRIFPSKMRAYHPEIWWNEEMIREKTEELVELHPDLIEKKTIGKTVEGRKLDALMIGNQERMIAVIGAVHVSESGPELILGALKRLLEENPEIVAEVGIAALPCVTLDERERKLRTGHAWYLRKNAARVDLNRNFPAYWEELPPPGTPQTDDPDAEIYRGPSPGSEPETQSLMGFLKDVEPDTSIFFHSLGSIASAGFVSSQYAVSEGDEEFVDLVEKIGRIYAHGMYGDDYTEYYWHHHTSRQGSHNVWLYKHFRSPAVSLELDTYEKGQAVYYDGVTPELMEEFEIRHKNAFEAIIQAIIDGEIERLDPKETE